jgi:hypothetical protein
LPIRITLFTLPAISLFPLFDLFPRLDHKP